MSGNAFDWLDLLLRWFHVMAGVSWIGGSLYLLWLDRIFASPERRAKGEYGEPWLIDQLGSLLVEKLQLGPDGMAKTHVWFKRETTLTWVSGILLLALLAHLPGGGLLIDAGGEPIGTLLGASVVAVLIVLSWVCYDLIWRPPTVGRPILPGGVSFALFAAIAWLLSEFFSGRATFILAGASLGSLMMGNIWFRILPALKEISDARTEGRPADVDICAKARLRAVHNSYLIFPTIVLMLSNHYPAIYGHSDNWLILALLMAAFLALRHVVVSGKAGKRMLWLVAGFGAAAFLVATIRPPDDAAGAATVSFVEARTVIIERCLSCHSTVPSDREFGAIPAGVTFDRPENIKRHAQRIKVRAVDERTMPIRRDNAMTAAERKMLGRWVDEGARLN